MRRLHKYFALTPAGRALFLRSLLLLPLATVLLRALGMARTTGWLERLVRRADHKRTAMAPLEIARLVNAGASILGIPCLPRSLVLCHLLHHIGVAAQIRLGVSKLADAGLSAHAWVELDGLPLNDSVDVSERYSILHPSEAILRVDHS